MLAPGLGKRFQLHIGGFPAQIMEILADSVQLGKVKRKRAPPLAGQAVNDPLFSKPCKFTVIQVKIHCFCSRQFMQADRRHDHIHALRPVLLPGPDSHPAHERVCQG